MKNERTGGMSQSESRKGSSAKWAKLAACLGLVVILCLLPLWIRSQFFIHIIIITFIYVIATASLRTITVSGQFPLAHAAFMGIGAYASAVVSKQFGLPPWLTIPLGGLVAMGVGILIGFPFARLRALYYAMVSLFFGIGVLQVFFVLNVYTLAYRGLTGIPPLLPGATKVHYYYFFMGFTLFCLLALYRFEFSRIGTTLRAIGQSHQVASSVGISEAKYKVLVLAVGCFFVGVAGGAYAHYNRTLSYPLFDMSATLWLFMYVLIGGIGSFAGPIVGTAILMIFPELFRELKAFVPYVTAAILFIVVFAMPQGLVGLPGIIRARWRGAGKEKGIAAAS
jgi:branched-chain amino acid transport system permease protein